MVVMSYFISSNEQSKLNDKVKSLELERDRINNNLIKYQSDLNTLKKRILFSFFKKYRLKLENLIDKEESLKKNNFDNMELIKEINSKIRDLVVVMHTKGKDKSLFEEDIYYECMSLYNKLCLEIYNLCTSVDLNIDKLNSLNSFLDIVYSYYQDVNFDELDLDFNIDISLDDFDLYLENSSFIEYICYCFKNEIKYDDFAINAKKYLTIRKYINTTSVRKISKGC